MEKLIFTLNNYVDLAMVCDFLTLLIIFAFSAFLVCSFCDLFGWLPKGK